MKRLIVCSPRVTTVFVTALVLALQVFGQSAANRSRVEAEIVTLTSSGFEPSQLNRTRDPFVLRVDNRSGSKEMSLVLDRETGERVREMKVPRHQLDWGGLLTLEPGTYFLRETSHPEWVCQITVKPH